MTFLQRLWERWTVNQIGSDAWMRSRGFHKSTEEELATARRLHAIIDPPKHDPPTTKAPEYPAQRD